MKKTLTLDEKNILKYFGIDLNEFYKSSAKEQKTIISILNKFYSYHLLSEEIKKDRNNSWNSLEIRQGLKYLRETKREIESELRKIKLKNSNEYKELNKLNTQVLSEIEELNDLYKEAISPNQNTSSPEPESNSDKIKQEGILTNFIDGLKEGTKWGLIILGLIFLGLCIGVFVAISQYSDSQQVSNTAITTPEKVYNSSSNENNNLESYKDSSIITHNNFNQEIFNNIQVKGEETSKTYNRCTSLIKDKYSKINLVRDQSTLYQFDGDVRDCINEYLMKAKEFIQIIKDNPGQITHNSVTSIQNQLISNSNDLKKISQQYSSVSSQRHYYIHGVYQTNSLIQLAEIIGETSGAVASSSPIDAINSLQELSDWVHDNGGVIDTGWNQ